MPYGPRNKAIQTKRKTMLTIQELDQAVMWLDQAVIGQPVAMLEFDKNGRHVLVCAVVSETPIQQNR